MAQGQHTIIREHEICAGHTVTGHEGKCRHLHGHNYKFKLHVRVRKDLVTDNLDSVGRVIDFSVVKDLLCEWLENQWDHKFLINKDDPRLAALCETDPASLVICEFNPTAENMAGYLVEVIGPAVFHDTDVELFGVELYETSKCCATYFKD